MAGGDTHVVTKWENDDGTWNAQAQYLRVDIEYGVFEWVASADRATKMTFLNAVTFSTLCRLGGDEYADKEISYSYGIKVA